MTPNTETTEEPSHTGKILETVNRTLSVIKANRNLLIGTAILVPIVVLSIFAPMLIPQDPTATNTENRFATPGDSENLLGTDQYGRDSLSRLLLGGRTTLFIGVGSVALALMMGIPTGLVAGYSGGYTDEFIMRLMDILMSIPTLILALLVIVAAGASTTNAVIAIGIVYTPRIARVVRGSTLSVKNREYVKAAVSQGESHFYIMFREILPNITSPVIVEGSVRIGYAIIIGASLSFLGLGAQPPTPDWGYMIDASRGYMWHSIWLLVLPSLALALTIFSFNLIGDGLRDVLDPKTVDK